MASLSADRRAALDTLLQQIGLELAFVDTEQKGGIAVMRDLVRRLSAGVGDDAPDAIRQAVATAGRWLDDRAADGRFSEETIAALNGWHPWLGTALAAWAHGRPCPDAPAAWTAGEVRAAGEAIPAPAAPLRSPAPAETIPKATLALPEGPFEDQHVEIAVKPADADLMGFFCADAHDLLQEIEQGVLALEKNPRDEAALNTLFRAFHTFKGNVGVMKLVVLQQLTHELESLLDAARRGTFHLERDSFDVVLAGADVLKRYVEELTKALAGGGDKVTLPLPIPRIIAHLRALLARGRAAGAATSARPAASTTPVALATPAPVAMPSATGSPPASNVGVPTAAPEAAAPVGAVEPPAQADAPGDVKVRQRQGGGVAAAAVRVDTGKLDSLVDLVGELVIAQSMVVQSASATALTDSNLSRTLGQLRGITSDLQRTAMSLRMVPIRATFQKMSRLVRDLAVQQDKDIRLVLQGEDTELDRTLVEELGDPLIHMIRNSADHGIEPAAERIAAGKPAHGTIALRAFHQGGFIVIEIADDGRGLSAERIRAKAIERGLLGANDAIDERALLELIFAPGFSTAEQITDLSGRGVGMDVVRRNIEKMRGKIEIDSAVGRGTTFTISMPLTLAIIEGLLVGLGEQRYVIPTLAVRESFRPLPGMVSTVQGRGEVVSVRGRLTPLLRLGTHLNTPARAHDPTQGIVVVVESGADCRCLLVDELIGKQEVVIKSLGDTFRNQADFAGAAILGDGRVGLILDVNALVKLKHRNGEHAA